MLNLTIRFHEREEGLFVGIMAISGRPSQVPNLLLGTNPIHLDTHSFR